MRLSPRSALCALLLLTAAPAGLAAQTPPPPAPLPPSAPSLSSGRVFAGALAGAVGGTLAAGLAGAFIGANLCEHAGQPDSCHFVEGTLTGAAIGLTVGAPLGANLFNRRRGLLGGSVLASTAITVGGAAALLLAETNMSGDARHATMGAILLAIPIAQLVSATAIETRTGRR